MELKQSRSLARAVGDEMTTRRVCISDSYSTELTPDCQPPIRVVEDFLCPLADRAEQLAQRDADPARRKRHAKLARYLVHRIARYVSQRRARWWFEVGGDV
jgi:hypothetical protein